MLLFLDRLPLLALDTTQPEDDRPSAVPLPIVAAEDEQSRRPPRRPARFYPWLLDTGFTGQTHVWHSDIRALGLNLGVPLRPHPGAFVSAFGERAENRVRRGVLWLFSNVLGWLDTPLLLPLSGGLTVHVPPMPVPRRGGLGLPLIGTRLLARAGAHIDISFRRRTLSLWLPASPVASALQWPRRLLGRPEPVAWHR